MIDAMAVGSTTSTFVIVSHNALTDQDSPGTLLCLRILIGCPNTSP